MDYVNRVFEFVLSHMRPIELFVFWYPVTMGLLWVIGGLIYYFRIERKKPLPLVQTPMVSVLVPAFNEGDNIINTVKRLRRLKYPNYEIIVINDGSSDDSPETERVLSEMYDNVRFVDLKQNCGKANALYLGFIASKGEFLVCVDGDSYLDPDCLNYMIPHFTTPNNGERVGAVTGNPRVRNRSSLLSKIQICEYASIISLIKRTQRIWGKVMTVSGVIVAFRKQALLDCGLWDRDMITEDIGVTWKLEKNFWDVRYEPRAICWMLVPETIKGLAKQRKRWAQGGQEVMFRHANIFTSWRRRRMIPIFLEQVCSLAWVLAWVLLTLTEIFRLMYDANSYIPYLWKSQFLSIVCIVQFLVAIALERKYDKKIFRNASIVAWYPLVYWVLTGIVSLWALPSSLFKRKKLATWKSPDRGIKTEDKADNSASIREKIQNYEIPDEDIIVGKQKWWKKIIEVITSVIAWLYILVYVAYMTYGTICRINGTIPKDFWIYNNQVINETLYLLYITMIIVLIEIFVLLFWKEYNKIRFSGKNRRVFKQDVTIEETSELFKIPLAQIEFYRRQHIITLERNIIPEDFKAVRPWKLGERIKAKKEKEAKDAQKLDRSA